VSITLWLTDIMTGDYNSLTHITALGIILLVLIVVMVMIPTALTMYMMLRSHPYRKPKTPFRRYFKANRETGRWRMK